MDRREEIMAERSAASTWKTERRQQDKCCSNARHGSSSSEPTLSGSLEPVHPDPDPSEASSDDEGGVHSESENERGASGSSSSKDVSDFNSKKARGIFDDWVAIVFLCRVKDASCHAYGDTAKENKHQVYNCCSGNCPDHRIQ